MSSANKAQAQSSAKRMQLSRDQKALLETVYAMEKLPDAALRERFVFKIVLRSNVSQNISRKTLITRNGKRRNR